MVNSSCNGMPLAKNRQCFDWAYARARCAAEKFQDPLAMAWASIAGRLTYEFHPGFFAHPGIEKLLMDIGIRHTGGETVPGLPGRISGQRHWVHVLTTALPVGGHTRLVEKWIQNAREISSDRHSVVLLDQGDNLCPDWLVDVADSTGGRCLALPDHLDPLDRALALRNLARSCADVVVLHIHPYDPIATVAFSESEGPPVVLLNHADHVFWIGASVSDLVTEFRPVGQEISMKRRGARQPALLPIPLLAPESLPDRCACREHLGIPEDKVVLLSIGSSYKYKAYGDLDFPAAMLETARRNPNVLVLVVGPSADEPEWKKVIEQSRGSIRVLGVIQGLRDYYRAADIYLEGFPIGSVTASLDAALVGTPVVRAPMLISGLLGIDHYTGMNGTARSMADYYSDLDRFIQDTHFRAVAAAEQKAAVEKIHVGQAWNAYLAQLAHCIPTVHNPSVFDGKPDLWPEDEAWANLQAAQAHPAGGLWRACCAALRSNSAHVGKWDMISSLLRCPASSALPSNAANAKEMIKFLIALLVPRTMYGYLMDRRRLLGRCLRG